MSRGRHAAPSATQKAISAGVSVTTTTLAAGAVAAIAVAGGHASASTTQAAPVNPVKAQVDAYVVHTAKAETASHYTVKSGDTLSGIAQANLGSAGKYECLAAANDIENPNLIYVGQDLVLDCSTGEISQQPENTSVSDPPASSTASDSSATTQDSPSSSYGTSSAHVSTGAMSSYEQCVISRESGGNAAAVNPESGAGGLFQFLPQTWEGLGYSGLPEDAPVSEQEQAFNTLYAESGSSPWETDGCG